LSNNHKLYWLNKHQVLTQQFSKRSFSGTRDWWYGICWGRFYETKESWRPYIQHYQQC
jgi:hypothetical protein